MEEKVRLAFQRLMGLNGDQYAEEISNTQALTEQSYKAICDNIYFNDKSSVIEHFGIVHYYYLQGLKKAKLNSNKSTVPEGSHGSGGGLWTVV